MDVEWGRLCDCTNLFCHTHPAMTRGDNPLSLREITTRLHDREALESHLQTEYVHNALSHTSTHPRISVEYYGTPDLNIGYDDIEPDGFDLKDYAVRNGGMGSMTVTLRASADGFVPTKNCEYGPGGHDIELAESRFIYKATVRFGLTDPYVEGSVFIVAVA